MLCVCPVNCPKIPIISQIPIQKCLLLNAYRTSRCPSIRSHPDANASAHINTRKHAHNTRYAAFQTFVMIVCLPLQMARVKSFVHFLFYMPPVSFVSRFRLSCGCCVFVCVDALLVYVRRIVQLESHSGSVNKNNTQSHSHTFHILNTQPLIRNKTYPIASNNNNKTLS